MPTRGITDDQVSTTSTRCSPPTPAGCCAPPATPARRSAASSPRSTATRSAASPTTADRARSSSSAWAARASAATCWPPCAAPGAPCRSRRCATTRCPAGWARSTSSSPCRARAGTEETLNVAAEAGSAAPACSASARPEPPRGDRPLDDAGVFLPVDAGDLMPRACLWPLSTPLLVVADALGLADVPDSVLERAADVLDSVSTECGVGVPLDDNPAKMLALSLAGSVPMVWGTAFVGVWRRTGSPASSTRTPSSPSCTARSPRPTTTRSSRSTARSAARRASDIFRDPVEDGAAPARLRLVLLRDSDEHPQDTRRAEVTRDIAERRACGARGDRAQAATPSSGSPRSSRWPTGRASTRPSRRRRPDADRPDQRAEGAHRVSTEGGTKAVLAALAANIGIAVTKFVAFAFTGSSSMLAEAIHSVADSGNQVLLLVGGKRAQRRPTPSTRSATAASGTSTRSSSRSCCSASAACSHLRGLAQDPRARAADQPDGGVRRPGHRDRARGVLVPDRDPRGQQEPRHQVPARASCGRPPARAAGGPARGRRCADRSGVRARRRQLATSPATAAGTASARSRSARCWSSSRCSCARDGLDARRRERRARAGRGDPGRARVRAHGRPRDPPAHAASRARRAARRGQDRRSRHRHGRRRSPRPSTPPRPGSGPPCPRRAGSTSSRTSTAARPPERPESVSGRRRDRRAQWGLPCGDDPRVSTGEPTGLVTPAAYRPSWASNRSTRMTTPDYKVADLSLAEFGRNEIRLAEHEMPGLMAMREEYGPSSRSPAPASPARCT